MLNTFSLDLTAQALNDDAGHDAHDELATQIAAAQLLEYLTHGLRLYSEHNDLAIL